MDLASSLEHKKILLYGIQLQTPKVSSCSRVDVLSTGGVTSDLKRVQRWLPPLFLLQDSEGWDRSVLKASELISVLVKERSPALVGQLLQA